MSLLDAFHLDDQVNRELTIDGVSKRALLERFRVPELAEHQLLAL